MCIKAEHIFYLHWPGLEFLRYAWDRRRVGLPTSRARARVRRLTPTDRYPRDSNPGPLDLKSSILPLSYRPPDYSPLITVFQGANRSRDMTRWVIMPRHAFWWDTLPCGDGWHFGAADGPNAAVVVVGWVVKFEGRLF